MADVKWIKIVTDVFDDEKILLVESLPEADSIIVIWFKLLCLAGKQNNSGVFLMNDKIPYTDKMLATIFRRKESTVQLALRTFQDFGMIEIVDGVITIPNWEKHQKLDQLEMAKEQTRQRVARHRAKQKLLASGEENNSETECNVTGNVTEGVTVTQCNGDRIDKIRIDKNRIDKKKESKKESKKTFDDLIDSYTSNAELQEELRNHLATRKAKKATLTNRAIELSLKKLDELTSNVPVNVQEEEKIKIVQQSIERGWVGFFEIKDQQTTSNKKSSGWDYMNEEFKKIQEKNDIF